VSKLRTLIIEIDYIDFKNQLLQALFNIYGDRVLETLVHEIDQKDDEKETYEQLQRQHFQDIGEYVEAIRRLHDEEELESNRESEGELLEMKDELAYLYPT